MISRLIHIGDAHVQSGHARNVDRLRALDDVIAAHGDDDLLGAWLWPGDLFHTKSTVQDRLDIAERLQKMADRAPVLICRGNHDQVGDLLIFSKLRARHPIYVFEQPTTIALRLATGEDAACFLLPYPDKSMLVASGVAKADIADVGADPLEAILRHHGALLERARSNGAITFSIGHVNIGGSRLSNGNPNIGVELELSPSLLSYLQGGYIGLNHIHLPQQIGAAWYAGSVCRLSYGETEEKRYLVVDVGKGDEICAGASASDGWIWAVESRPISVAPMYSITGELDRDGFTPDPDTPWDQDFTDAYVRCTFRFDKSMAGEVDRGAVERYFRGARQVQLEPVAISDRAVRAPELASANTLAEKAAVWARLNRLDLTPHLLDKLTQLEQRDGREVLSYVQRSLTVAEEPVTVEL